MAAAEEAGADGAGAVREQDKFLPIANINRIMKEALPHNAKVSKDAKELVQQCVSDFIIYITSQCGPDLRRTPKLAHVCAQACLGACCPPSCPLHAAKARCRRATAFQRTILCIAACGTSRPP